MKKITGLALAAFMLMRVVSVQAAEDGGIYITKAYISEDGSVVAEMTCQSIKSGENAVVMAAGYDGGQLYDLEDIVYFNTFYPDAESGSYTLSLKPADWMGEKNRAYVVMIAMDTMDKADYMVIDMDNDTPSEVYWGDVNRDGKIDETDAELIMQYVLKSESTVLDYDAVKRADISADKSVDASDAAMVMKIAMEERE